MQKSGPAGLTRPTQWYESTWAFRSRRTSPGDSKGLPATFSCWHRLARIPRLRASCMPRPIVGTTQSRAQPETPFSGVWVVTRFSQPFVVNPHTCSFLIEIAAGGRNERRGRKKCDRLPQFWRLFLTISNTFVRAPTTFCAVLSL